MYAFERHSGIVRLRNAAVLLASMAVLGCAAPATMKTVEAFRDTQRLETQLRRGVSTLEDIRGVLGEPTGRGAAFLPSVQSVAQELWFYQDIELTDIKAVQGQIDLVMRQQILIVFVREGRYDGFMWFSNSDAATGWIKDSLRGRIR